MAKTKLTADEQAKMDAVFRKALYCHVAFSDEKSPYILALSFGRHENTLYFHGNLAGKKMRLIEQNPEVGFALEHAVAVKKNEKACKFSISYASIVGSGKAAVVEDPAEKTFGLNVIVGHYGAPPERYTETALRALSVVKIVMDEISYKESGL